MATQGEQSGLDYMPRRWGWVLGLGVIMIIGGVLALVASLAATLASVLFFGWILLFTGVAEGVSAFTQGKWWGVVLHILNGVLMIVAGLLLVNHPGIGALALTLLMAMFFMIGGLFRIVAALLLRFEHRAALALSGVVTLLLGVFIWRQLPGAAVWVIGTLVGVDLVFAGWSWVALGLAVRARSSGTPAKTA